MYKKQLLFAIAAAAMPNMHQQQPQRRAQALARKLRATSTASVAKTSASSPWRLTTSK